MGMHNTRAALSRQGPYLWLVLLALMLANLLDPAARFYDEHLRPVPWISAELEILPAIEDGEGLLISYDVRARLPVSGTWSAWLEVGGRQRCFGGGYHTYRPETIRARIWPLTEWLAMTCRMPATPFSACVKYEVTTERGAAGGFGPYCSPIYDPREDER